MGKKEVYEIFQDMSGEYDTDRVRKYFTYTVDVISEYASPGSKVLDVCCGTGDFSMALAERGCTVKGFDFSEKMVDVAEKKAKESGVDCVFRHGDAEQKYPFDEMFDMILINGCYEYFEKPHVVLGNAAQVLKEDGVIMVVTPNPTFSPLIKLLELTGVKKLKPTFYRYNSFKKKVVAEVEKAGLKLERHYHRFFYMDQYYILKHGR